MLSRRRCMQALVFVGVELGLRSVLVTPTLTVTPNPAPPSTLVAVAGSGFPNAKTRLLLDGVGATTNIFRPRSDGTFDVGITVASTAKTQTLVAQQLSGSTWSDKATTMITVLIPPSPLPPPPSPSVYGMAIGGDTPANTQIGGVNGGGYNSRLSGRFRAGSSSTLTSVRIYIIANGNTGYAGGTGGVIQATLQTDDGTANHGPSGMVLATSASLTPGNPTTNKLPLITFPTPATVTAGTLYHVVFENIDAAPTVNYCSINALYTWQPVTPRQPKYSDVDWGQMVDQGAGWTQRPGYSHIMGISYGNGVGEGMGYMGAWQQTQPAIGGTCKVREQFTVSGGDHSVTSVSVRLKRDGTGTSPLTVRLETGAGTLIEEGDIPYSAFPIGTSVDGSSNRNSWGSLTFASAHTLVSGSVYHLVLSAPADTTYRAEPLQKGSGYSFPPASYYTDGYGQKSADGTTWTGFDQPGGTSSRTDGDLQFVFRS